FGAPRSQMGPCRGPQRYARCRGAPRLRRGAPSQLGGGGTISGPHVLKWGHVGAPSGTRVAEARHGSAGARRASWGVGGPFRGPTFSNGAMSGPPAVRALPRRATAPPG